MASRPWSAIIVAAALGACASDPVASVREVEVSTAVVSAASFAPTGARLVRYREGRRAEAVAAVIAAGGRVARELPQIGLLQVTGLAASGETLQAQGSAISSVVDDQRVMSRPAPRFASLAAGTVREAPVGSQGTDQSTAFFYPVQWNMRVTSANAAWKPSGGGSGKVVCILDTGIDPGHIDLAGKVDASRTATGILFPRYPSDATPLDYDFHGTFTAALAVSNGLGIASTAPNGTLCSIKVLSEDGFGSFGDVLYAILQAADWNADVINMSLGAVLDVAEPIYANLAANLQAAVNYALAKGSLVVAASGNLGVNFDEVPRRFIHVPSMLTGVVSVGATAPYNQSGFDQLASYSNVGSVRTVDLVAPGGDLLSGGVTQDLVISACSQYARSLPFSCGRSSFLYASGTSFASPMVAGAALVVESTIGDLTPAASEACLKSAADRVGGRWLAGAGRLNVAAALGCT